MLPVTHYSGNWRQDSLGINIIRVHEGHEKWLCQLKLECAKTTHYSVCLQALFCKSAGKDFNELDFHL